MTDATAEPTIQELMRDAAVQRDQERRDRDRGVVNVLRLGHGYRIVDVIHLSDTTAIAEVSGVVTRDGSGTYFTVVHNGDGARRYVKTLAMALIYAAQVMAGGRLTSTDHEYAARVLRIED